MKIGPLEVIEEPEVPDDVVVFKIGKRVVGWIANVGSEQDPRPERSDG